jgi:hypothetical protein
MFFFNYYYCIIVEKLKKNLKPLRIINKMSSVIDNQYKPWATLKRIDCNSANQLVDLIKLKYSFGRTEGKAKQQYHTFLLKN